MHAQEIKAQILIVDDDPNTLRHYTEILELEHYRVLAAVSAENALSAIREVRPDAAVVDLRMPTLNGLVVLRELRAKWPEQPVPAAMVTGDYLVGDAEVAEARACGARVVFKPLWVDELLLLVKALLCEAETFRSRPG